MSVSREGLEPPTKCLTYHSRFLWPRAGGGLDYIFTISGALLIVSEDSLEIGVVIQVMDPSVLTIPR